MKGAKSKQNLFLQQAAKLARKKRSIEANLENCFLTGALNSEGLKRGKGAALAMRLEASKKAGKTQGSAGALLTGNARKIEKKAQCFYF